MFQFFESIKIDDGHVQNLNFHQERVDKTIVSNFDSVVSFTLEKLIEVPEAYRSGIVKCRFSYDLTGFDVQFEKYVLKPISTLKLIKDDLIDYNCKASDRKSLELLLELKGNCDDVLIVKNGLVTDISFANIVFYDGIAWYTPDSALLEGTCRSRLLAEGRIISKRIIVENLKEFSHFSLINAMRGDTLEDLQLINQIYR